MKKILLSLITIALVGALIGGGVYAYFSDIESSTENTFTAGTLDLELTDSSPTGTDSETQTWVFSGMKPDDSNGATLTISSKAGSIDGYLDLSNISLNDDEGTDSESETNTTAPGDLSGLLYVHMFFDLNNNGNWDAGEPDIYGNNTTYAQLSLIGASYDLDQLLTGGSTTYITLKYNWPTSANDNDAQGDITTFTFDVELDQTAD